MKALNIMERRLVDLERAIENMHRQGEVKDVKYDSERKRWYVKMEDGEGDGTTFKSDWLPWKSFSHGSIKVSMPPKKGMKIAMTSPGGQPEMAFAEPFHNDPKTGSPHDKQDEVVMTIESEDGTESMRIFQSKGESTVTIGNTVFSVKKDGVSIKTKAFSIEAETFTAKTGSVDWTNA